MASSCLRWAVSAVALSFAAVSAAWANEPVALRVTTFQCNITPPLGQPMFSCDALRTVEEPLLAKGIVLEAAGQRYVLCALDWCELCNGTYDSMRSKIAQAAGTDTSHVAVQTIHQHTAPLVDMDSQKLLAEAGFPHGIHIDPEVYADIEKRLVASVKQSLDRLEPFDRIGVGQAKVDRVASSRRPRDKEGNIRPRGSNAGIKPAMRALPEGKIDPFLKTITFARGDKPLVRLHYYATHPQSKYSDNRATSDVPGIAREKLQTKEGVFQIYFTGCGGDITFGKYNDGSPKDRKDLATRLLAGMEASVAATKLGPVGEIQWRTCPVVFPRRTDAGFSLSDSLARMKAPDSAPVTRFYTGALRAAFHHRAGTPIELTSLQVGNVHIVHLPGEPLIDFQLYAQGLKPNDFVAVAGYGDCGTGYLCPEKAYAEGGYEPTDANAKPESEALVNKAIAKLLGGE
jgi:hypothetical protein